MTWRAPSTSPHPLANALAQQKLEEVKYITVPELIENWVGQCRLTPSNPR